MKRLIPRLLIGPLVGAACADADDAPLLLDGDGGTVVPDPDAGSEVPEGGVSPPPDGTCGDGRIDEGEACDDGNVTANDGCSPTCKVESAGATDTCPGTTIDLVGSGAETRTGTITGTTATNFNHYAGSCGGGTGRDAVYTITPDVTGLLTAKLTSTFDSMLYARKTCDDAKTEAACNDAPGLTGGEIVKVPVSQGQPVFLFVDGYAGTAGTFTIDVEVSTAFCGNGVAEPPEACDDGNTAAGDGCSATCTLEPGGVIESCPGQEIKLAGSGTAERKVSLANSTAALKSSTLRPLPSTCTGAGYNRVYAISSDVGGSMKVRMVAEFANATLHLRPECDTGASTFVQLDCKESPEAFEPIELTVPIAANEPVYVIADATTATYRGAYTLDVSVTPAACGNKILDGNETCDDGNTVAGDGCGADCKLEPIAAGTDACPGAPLTLTMGTDGKYAAVITSSTATLANHFKPLTTQGGCLTSPLANDAIYVVTSPIDGLLKATVTGSFDSAVYVRANACDPDGAAATDLACSGAVEGNGAETVQAPIKANTPVYVIVDGEATAASGVFELDVSVSPAACGNGNLEGGETCDDGNTRSGDGCTSACQLEPATTRDTCDTAEPVSFTQTPHGTYTASVMSGTINLTHDQTFTGCTSSGRDAFFLVTAPIDGVLTAEVPDATFDVSLGGRNTGTCPTTAASVPLACSAASDGIGPEQISFSVTKDQTYWVIVDSETTTAVGTYTLLMSIRPPGCGDGLLSGAEQCDDGNVKSGDGCSPTCTVEALAGLDTCPGYALPLAGTGTEPRTGVVTVDTATLAGNYAGSCGGNAKDAVVVVTPPVNGKLTARYTGINYSAVLYARSTCADAATQLSCDADNTTTGPGTSRDLTIASVTAGTPYYLFLDGYNGQSGVGRLNVTVTP